MTRVLYPGSFDPIHNGHLELIEVAAEVFDEVVVATIRNPQKSKGLFDIDERLAMIEESVAHLPNVSVTSFASLVVDPHHVPPVRHHPFVRGLEAHPRDRPLRR